MARLKKFVPIKSSSQALKESKELRSVWSEETRLTQRILIRILEVLEKMGNKKKVPPTEWNRYVSKHMKAGLTIKEIGELWRNESASGMRGFNSSRKCR